MSDNDGKDVTSATPVSQAECPNCHHPLAGNEVFCPKCLQRLSFVPEQVSVEQPRRVTFEEVVKHPRFRLKVPLAVKWVAVVVLFGLAAVMVWYGWLCPTAQTYMVHGDSLYQQGQFEQALQAYSTAANMEPDLATAHLQMGWCLYRMARDKEAVARFQQALQLNPSLGDAYLGLGKTYYYLQDYQAAEQNLIKAQQMVPQRRDVYAYLGGTYIEENRTADAVGLLEKAVQLNPVDAKALFDLGRAKYNMKDYRAAADALLQASRLAPANLEAQEYLVKAYQELGDHQHAVSILRGLVKARPDDLGLQVHLGRSLYALGQYDEALDVLTKVLDWSRQNGAIGEAYLYMGWVAYQQGHNEGAMQAFQAAYALDPGRPEAYDGMGLTLVKMGRCPEAVPLLKSALSRQPGWSEVEQALETCK